MESTKTTGAQSPRYFPTVEAAAEWIRVGNPTYPADATPQEVLDNFAQTYPDLVRIDPKYAPPAFRSGRTSLADPLFNEKSILGGTLQAFPDIAEGALSAALLGMGKRVGQETTGSPNYGNSPGYKVGEFIGEGVGGYGLIGAAGKFAGRQAVKRFPQMAATAERFLMRVPKSGGSATFKPAVYAAGEGLKSTGVELIKGLIAGENVWDLAEDMPVNFAIGAAPDYGYRKWVEGKDWSLAKVFNMSDAEYAAKKPQIDYDMSIGAPLSPAAYDRGDVVNLIQSRTQHSAASKRVIQSLEDKRMSAGTTMQNSVVGRFGEDSTIPKAQETGRAVIDGIEEALSGLKRSVDDAHDLMRGITSSTDPTKRIGDVLIDPRVTTEFTYESGSKGSGSLMGDLSKVVGRRVKDVRGRKIPLAATWEGKLDRMYAFLEQALETIPEEYVTQGKGEPGLAWAAEALKDIWEGGEEGFKYALKRSVEGNERNFYVTHGVKVPTYSFTWWDDVRKKVGTLLKSNEVQNDPNARRAVGNFYHSIKNHIDAQAAAADPLFEVAIKEARSLTVIQKNMEKSPLVKALRNLGEEGKTRVNESKVIPLLFSDVSSVRDAKQLLSPESFAIARQVYLADMIWNSFVRGSKGQITNLDGQRFRHAVGTKGINGIYGEFWTELFSDEGFLDPMGNPVVANIDTERIGKAFKEFLFATDRFDEIAPYVKSGGEQFSGQMIEKFSIGALIKNPSLFLSYMKGLASQFFLMGKAADLVFNQDPNRNLFFKGSAEKMGAARLWGKEVGGIPLGLSRPNIVSTIGNRLYPTERKPSETAAALSEEEVPEINPWETPRDMQRRLLGKE